MSEKSWSDHIINLCTGLWVTVIAAFIIGWNCYLGASTIDSATRLSTVEESLKVITDIRDSMNKLEGKLDRIYSLHLQRTE